MVVHILLRRHLYTESGTWWECNNLEILQWCLVAKSQQLFAETYVMQILQYISPQMYAFHISRNSFHTNYIQICCFLHVIIYHIFSKWRETETDNLLKMFIDSSVLVQQHLNIKHALIWLTLVTLKFDGWPWKTIGYLFYSTSSSVHHFTTIREFKLELPFGNAKLRSKSVAITRPHRQFSIP